MHKGKIRKERSFFGSLCTNTNRAVKGVQNESGSVESALVLIPLLILFLVTMQIGVAINFRNIDRTFAQSEASERAISGRFTSADQVMEVNPFGTFNTLGILITRKVSSIPILIPFFGSFINRSHRSDVTGIAVVETLP
jgi:predicted transporter